MFGFQLLLYKLKPPLCFKSIFPEKEMLPYDDIQRVAFTNDGHFRRLYSVGWIYRCKGLERQRLVYQNTLVNTKWVDMFAELEMNSYNSKTLWLLKSRILRVPSSKAFVVRMSSWILAHRTDTRAQGNVSLVRVKQWVKVSFTVFSWSLQKEKKGTWKVADRPVKYYWKRLLLFVKHW